jgi:amino acid permease
MKKSLELIGLWFINCVIVIPLIYNAMIAFMPNKGWESFFFSFILAIVSLLIVYYIMKLYMYIKRAILWTRYLNTKKKKEN